MYSNLTIYTTKSLETPSRSTPTRVALQGTSRPKALATGPKTCAKALVRIFDGWALGF
jgi:hypothetical protein